MNALAVMQSAQVNIVAVQVTKPATRSLRKLVALIREQAATTEEVRYFIAQVGDKLKDDERLVVRRAYARAKYREGQNLSVTELSLISKMTEKQIRGHMSFLGIRNEDLNCNEATRIMCRDQND